jgi:hypothetical protein
MSDAYAPPRADLLGGGGPTLPDGGGQGVYPIDVGVLLSRSWTLLQPALVPVTVGVFMLIFINLAISIPFSMAQVAAQAAAGAVADENGRLALNALGIFLQLVGGVVSLFTAALVSIGMSRGTLELVRTGNCSIGSFLPPGPGVVLRGGIAQMLLTVAVLAGVCALVVPGVYIGLSLYFWPLAMVAEDLGPIDALKRSWQLSEGNRLGIFLWGLVSGLMVAFIGLPTCGLGIAPVVGLMWVGFTLAYEGAAARLPARG